jgi:hypothetical protein
MLLVAWNVVIRVYIVMKTAQKRCIMSICVVLFELVNKLVQHVLDSEMCFVTSYCSHADKHNTKTKNEARHTESVYALHGTHSLQTTKTQTGLSANHHLG